jgi:splicing factor 3B subunit 3
MVIVVRKFSPFFSDAFDSYIILSFVNGTLVLSIGETIEEVQDTGFLSSAPTLAVQQIGADALLQVHPHGIRHVLADRRVNEWRVPQGKTIVSATTNKRQVVVALSSAELVYFELDLDGQLNEYQDRKAMGSTVLALSIGEVPEGRQRTPYLVSSNNTLASRLTSSIKSRPSVVRTRLFVSSHWILKAHSKPSVCKH